MEWMDWKNTEGTDAEVEACGGSWATARHQAMAGNDMRLEQTQTRAMK